MLATKSRTTQIPRPQVHPSSDVNRDQVISLLESQPIPSQEDGTPLRYDYGTAGFRYNAKLMPCIAVRMGLFAALRSSMLGEEVGIMITASHNDESYNGIKISDPDGGMLRKDGEELAIRIANLASSDGVWNLLLLKLKHHSASASASASPKEATATLHVARDTRDHSPSLSNLVLQAAQAMGASVVDHGLLTTPQLHHVVRHANPHCLPNLIPPHFDLTGYYDLQCHAYLGILRTTKTPTKRQKWKVDCACGVGFPNLQLLDAHLQALDNTDLAPKIWPVNGPGHGPLNEQCGAEFVQKTQQAPTYFLQEDADAMNISNGTNEREYYCASLDGDADRIVFYNESQNGLPSSFQLLDGDKIAVLVCACLQQEVKALRDEVGDSIPKLRLGVVQTAYANGASTAYLKNILGDDNVVFAKTGVKYVHAAAHENFDVGVYFEANGHGTTLFGKAFYQAMAEAETALQGVHPRNSRAKLALQRLRLLPSLINQAVGDALCDLLLVDVILRIMDWTIVSWSSLYQDLPSRQCKVKVRDRTIIKTNENETQCIAPATVQPALDTAIRELGGCRTFVRPSGTENVVRVYAEAATQKAADQLATKAAMLVHKFCDGIGEPPSFVSSL